MNNQVFQVYITVVRGKYSPTKPLKCLGDVSSLLSVQAARQVMHSGCVFLRVTALYVWCTLSKLQASLGAFQRNLLLPQHRVLSACNVLPQCVAASETDLALKSGLLLESRALTLQQAPSSNVLCEHKIPLRSRVWSAALALTLSVVPEPTRPQFLL